MSSPSANGRRWYHLRPKPRRRTDRLGFNSMVVVWLIVIILVRYPYPCW
jgi:hypothetical protein